MAINSRLTKGKSRKRLIHKLIILTLLSLIIVALIIAFTLFRYVLKSNVITPGNEPVSFYIRSGSGYLEVRNMLFGRGLIINRNSFEWVADRKNYPVMVKPGHFILKPGMSNNDLINMLRSGAQVPVDVIFNNIRNKEELAGRISQQLEADSLSLLQCWNDRAFLKKLNTTPEKVLMIFIPNTYEFWWTTDAYGFTERMHREFGNFWNEERKLKAKSTRLSIEQVIILASIVEKETQKNDEKPSIAGVYLNRLRKDWPLQADPTVVYAVGDFEMKRVLTVHTKIDSPYNTYLHTGLPPGPICIPSISSIDAVLNCKKHDYMFFCARADLSGYHAFSRTLVGHNRNARAYQQSLNNRNIR
jgi:UPF0755 protein